MLATEIIPELHHNLDISEASAIRFRLVHEYAC